MDLYWSCELEAQLFGLSSTTKNRKEVMAAFLEKRLLRLLNP